MQLWYLTLEKKEALLKEKELKCLELKRIQDLTTKDMWRNDLDVFSAKLDVRFSIHCNNLIIQIIICLYFAIITFLGNWTRWNYQFVECSKEEINKRLSIFYFHIPLILITLFLPPIASIIPETCYNECN